MNAITDVKKGTTTVGVSFKGGLVLAADKRASMGFLIANKHVDKVVQLTDNILMTIAGGVGDAQALTRYLVSEAKLFELKNGRAITTNALASLLQNILYSGKGGFYPFMVQLILGGKEDKGFRLFSFDASGSKLDEDYVSTGSGSPFAYGVLEDGFKASLSERDAVSLSAKAINTAIKRDMGTGEGIDVWVVNDMGLRKLSKEEVSKHL